MCSRGTAMAELIRVENLKKYFPVRKGLLRRVTAQVKAVDGCREVEPALRTLADGHSAACDVIEGGGRDD